MTKLNRNDAHDALRNIIRDKAINETSIDEDEFNLKLIPKKADPYGFEHSRPRWINFGQNIIARAKSAHAETFSTVIMTGKEIGGYWEKELSDFIDRVLDEAGL